MNENMLEPIVLDETTYQKNGDCKFTVTVYQEGVKGKIVRHKEFRTIIAELIKEYPELRHLIDFKGRRKGSGDWLNVNLDIAQFSLKYPTAMFEVTRYESALIRKGEDEPKLRDLMTKINVLNGSINVFTLVETDVPEHIKRKLENESAN